MSGPMRWTVFFSVILVAAAGVTVLWTGLSAELLKAVASFAIVTLAAIALWALSSRH